MKRHFTSSRSCSSCLATTRPKRTYGSVRIDPDEAENSIAADEWLDTAGCALIPLADTENR